MKYFYLFFFILISQISFSQSTKLDSLLSKLNEKVQDTATVSNYAELSWEFQYCNVDAGLKYGLKGFQLAKKLDWENGIRKLSHNIAHLYYLKNDYTKGIKYNLISIKYGKKLKSDRSLARSYNNLGLNYEAISKFPEALKSYFLSLKHYRIANDQYGIFATYGNVGNVYLSLSDFEKSKKYQRLSEEMARKVNDTVGIINSVVNLALIDDRKNELDSAIHKYLYAMELSKKVNYQRGYFSICNNLGAAYTKKGDVQKAQEYILIPYNHYKKEELHYEFALASGNLGLNAMENGNFELAEKYLQDTRVFAIKANATDVEKDADYFLFDLYKRYNKLDKALFHYEEYIRLNDTLSNLAVQKQIAQQEAEFKMQKKTVADSLQRLKEIAESKYKTEQQESEVRQQKLYTYFGIGFSIVSLGFLFFIYRGLQQKKRANSLLEEKNSLIQKQKKDVEIQKLIIEEKHKEISDSINYAERLQRSLMASNNLLDKNLPEYFIYFNPKEAVSGDFYWASNLKNGHFLLACADSTGHGVPGAIMSMMNMTSLKEVVKDGIQNPDEILNQTRKNIIETLSNDGTAEGGKDGMDCSLLSFDLKNNKLYFALANNPLWVIRASKDKGTNELIEFSPDKMPVGRHDKQDVPFQLHSFELRKGDLIIAFTDGYADQFGGEKGKKFKYSGLKNILLQNSNSNLSDLNEKLSASFEDWKRDLEQVDDVCIIGVRI